MKNVFLRHHGFVARYHSFLVLLLCVIFAVSGFLFFLTAFAAVAKTDERAARIINGAPAAEKWTWMVSLSYTEDDAAHGHFCGGTLINSRFVLTAAHCVEEFVDAPESIHAIIGRSRLTDGDGTTIAVDGIILYPGYDPDTLNNDIALVRLSSEVQGYEPLPMLQSVDQAWAGPGARAMVLGWGSTDAEISVRPDSLQEAFIPIVDPQQCSDRLGLDFLSDSMFCGGVLSSTSGANDGVDACFGDSGGPLAVETPQGWRLAGITSWGFGCASDRYWGVYTRAAQFSDWANSTKYLLPFVITAPVVHGSPRVGEILRCNRGLYGGDIPQTMEIQWLDSESREYLSRKLDYSIKRADVGRSVACEITVSNAGGSVLAKSESIGPIFPRRASHALRVKPNSPVRDAGVYCYDKQCSLLITFTRNMSLVKILQLSGPRCGDNACRTVETWREAHEISSNTWRLPLKRGTEKAATFSARVIDTKLGKSIGFNLLH